MRPTRADSELTRLFSRIREAVSEIIMHPPSLRTIGAPFHSNLLIWDYDVELELKLPNWKCTGGEEAGFQGGDNVFAKGSSDAVKTPGSLNLRH